MTKRRRQRVSCRCPFCRRRKLDFGVDSVVRGNFSRKGAAGSGKIARVMVHHHLAQHAAAQVLGEEQNLQISAPGGVVVASTGLSPVTTICAQSRGFRPGRVTSRRFLHEVAGSHEAALQKRGEQRRAVQFIVLIRRRSFDLADAGVEISGRGAASRARRSRSISG